MSARRHYLAASLGAGCITALCTVSACRAIVGSYEVGPASDAGAGTDTKTDSIAIDSGPLVDSGTDIGLDAADGGLLTSCNAYHLAGSNGDGAYVLALKEGSVKVWCDMARDGGGWTLVALRSPSTSSSAWRGEAAVSKTKELTDPGSGGDTVLDVDWTELGFTQVIYDLGPPPTPTRALFSTLTSTQKSGARGALSLLPPPEQKPECVVDGVRYTACSPMPLGPEAGPPPGDPGKGLGWLFSPTGVSCWWAWDTSLGAQECKTAKAGGGHIWVK